MARKLKEIASARDASLMEAVCQSAHQIWQAGLGAFAAGQGQGEALFSKLVAEGASLQKRIGHAGENLIQSAATGGADSIANRHKDSSWEKLEKVFEDRVGRALHSLGVPTQADFRKLGRQIEELNRAIAQLPQASAQVQARAAKPTARQAGTAKRAKATAGKTAAGTVRRPARKKSGAATGPA